jgi:hypothetical protein
MPQSASSFGWSDMHGPFDSWTVTHRLGWLSSK